MVYDIDSKDILMKDFHGLFQISFFFHSILCKNSMSKWIHFVWACMYSYVQSEY